MTDPFDLDRLDAINPPRPTTPRTDPVDDRPKRFGGTAPDPAPKAAKPRQIRAKFSRQELTRHVATCVTCGASNDRRNAQAWASGHVNSNGGHRVALVLESVVADRELDEVERLFVLHRAADLKRDRSDPAPRTPIDRVGDRLPVPGFLSDRLA